MKADTPVRQAHLHRVLVIGFGLFVVFLLSALLFAVRTVRQIDRNAAGFEAGQSEARSVIERLTREQSVLNDRWRKLARRSDVVSREEILSQLSDSRQQMQSVLDSAYKQAQEVRETIFREGQRLLRLTVALFAVCVVLSVLCAIWTIRASTALFRKLAQQTNELSQLQLQVLETQEQTARRFSHELHDELGQSLTAVKANLTVLRSDGGSTARVDDCLQLVDHAIKDVREISQLLRPTILDDFGLEAAIHWLAENFMQRTGIEVSCESSINKRRLRDETETHLFRITQEALTNVARHSQAKQVDIHLTSEGSNLRLRIQDDGRGFQDSGEARSAPGLGLVGMQTRARGAGGELTVESAPGQGVKIEIVCPSHQ